MRDPARVSRLWLAIAVATLWLVRVGGEHEPEQAVVPGDEADGGWESDRRRQQRGRLRLVSVFRRGSVRLWAALLGSAPLPHGRFRPEPWPISLEPPAFHCLACATPPAADGVAA
ncbi:MAG: hypothetical protein ACR2PL_10090 [Dehalococcoidia bacterium]